MKNPAMVMVIEFKGEHLDLLTAIKKELDERKKRDRLLFVLGSCITALDVVLIVLLLRGLS